MIGETVKVEYLAEKDPPQHDPFGAPILKAEEVEVANVLVQPGSLRDDVSSTRPDGTEVKYTLHFPKTFTDDLEGLRVYVRGGWYHVIGHPDHYTPENTPTEWYMPVEVGVLHG